MKKAIIMLSLFLTACGSNYSEEFKQAQAELTQARDSIKMLTATIEALSYPANHRLETIKANIKDGDFESATSELTQLVSLFPNSPEARMEESLKNQIEAGIQAKIAEEKRIKALGFKALTDHLSVQCGNVKASFSNVTMGNTFVFDNYGYEYRYRQADKNNKYVTAAMSITSDDNNPKLPQCALYCIDGENLIYEETLDTRFARWDDYGSYLGNDADYNNDFSKVNTVKFKIGAELSNDKNKRPFAVVMKKENVLSRTHDNLSRPEISYNGRASFKSSLTIDDLKEGGDYVLIKRFNFEKL